MPWFYTTTCMNITWGHNEIDQSPCRLLYNFFKFSLQTKGQWNMNSSVIMQAAKDCSKYMEESQIIFSLTI